MIEDEMVGWHHRLDGRKFAYALRVGDGQGGLVCYSSWGHKESDRTEQLLNFFFSLLLYSSFASFLPFSFPSLFI